MTNKTRMVSVSCELLQDLIDSAQFEIDERVRAYGEDYRPHVLTAQRKVVADASAILAVPAEDVRAVGDEPVIYSATDHIDALLEGTPSMVGIMSRRSPADGFEPLYSRPQRPVVLPDVDKLAEIIRRVDGSHSLGAGSLAEKILDEFARLNP